MKKPVYDILNAGPRTRFMVRGADKRPVLVHNCIQAMARDIVAEQMLAGDNLPELHVVSMTHDEIIGTAPDNDAELVYDQLEHIMSQPPVWAPDLPVEAEGGWAKDYSK